MAYLLTVSRMDLSARRKRWADQSYDPGIRTFGSPELPMSYPGALVLVDDDGRVRKGVPLLSPKGMLYCGDRLLVACHDEIRSFGYDLSSSYSLLSEPWCNDLHSLRPSSHGVLVASTGVDALAEFSVDGKTLWQWWAVEHGFQTDLRKRPWSLDKDADHRRKCYPVDLQSTHVNAVAELDASTLIASLVHQDALISIDRASGDCSALLDGPRPHSARVVDGDSATFSVTFSGVTAGEAVLARTYNGGVDVLDRVEVDTSWLQDALFDGERWMLVDGANGRVLHTDRNGEVRKVDTFNPEWCLYEVLPWRDADLTM